MFNSSPDILTVKQVTELLPLGKNTIYSLIREGRIGTVRIGRRLLIPKKAIIIFLEKESNLAKMDDAHYNDNV